MEDASRPRAELRPRLAPHIVATLAGLIYLFSVWRLAEHGVQRPAGLDSIAVAAGLLVGVGATLARGGGTVRPRRDAQA